MANEIVKWRDGHITRALSLEKMLNLFEDYGSEGLLLTEIGTRLGSISAAGRMMRMFPSLKEAYQRGIDGRTVDGEANLLKRVNGFSKTLTSKTTRVVNGKETEVVTKEDEVYFPPDVAAIRVLLKGRESKRYSGDDEGGNNVNIYLDKLDSKL